MNRIFRMVLSLWILKCMPHYQWSVLGEIDEDCKKSKCACCVDNICHKGGNYENECTYGCIDGHRGARCYELCKDDCKSCTVSVSVCTSCYDGFFLGQTGDCKSCPPNCKTCNSISFCNACKEGFRQSSGSHTCDYSICPTNCECNQGKCESCKSGFYDTNQSCNYSCPQTCLACASSEVCSKCRDGYYNGYRLDDGNTNQLNNCTHKCRKTCTSCSSYDECLRCPDGKYGVHCQEDCSNGCRDNVCMIKTGQCNCSINFSGTTCTECISGKYGENCDESCPIYCENGICERTSGNCTNGCKTETLTGAKCDTCVIGRYGELCGGVCPENCKDKKCEKNSGKCSNGCKQNFTGTVCDGCIKGRYGDKCQLDCPQSCSNNECEKQTGNCFECVGNYIGDRCQFCRSGFYGLDCEQACSNNCLTSTCDIDNGKCESGCKTNFSGDKCCVNNDNCIQCTSNTECQICRSGYFQTLCEKRCPENCQESCEFSTGICIKGCRGSPDDPACALNLGQTNLSPPIGPIIGGVSAAVIVIMSVIIFVVFLLKRRRKEKPSDHQRSIDAKREHTQEGHVYENFCETQLLEDDVERNSTLNDARTAANVDEVEIEERSDNAAKKPVETYYSIGSNSHTVKVNDLFSYVTARHVDSFTSEFGNLAKDLDLTKHCTFAREPENLPLNRYNGIYPYDHSRVTISGEPEFFINACYIDGYKNRKKAYIASLGPTAKTTDKFSTFWRMIWNEKSDIIVMLTNLREASGMKCEKYWPDSESEKEEVYGTIKVTCRSIETFAEYTVRTFSISKGKEQRHILQLHYTTWPDKGVPQEVTSLVEFRQRVKAVPVTLGGPVTVHCSAGVGRSGTYIALDQLTEEGQREGSVDVFNCVNRMRQQRVNMVQTAEQYKFLYKALVHSLSFGCEALTAEEIQGLTYEADGKMFTDMFETLQQEVDIESQEDSDDRQENKRRHKDKNRRHSDIPANRSRVRLYLARADGHHDYINAVFINSFKIKNLFIAAQSPLPGTVEDFLCMIYQQNSSCVVALEESRKHNNDVGKYLPADNESYKCGDFIVTSSKCDTKEQYIKKKVSIQNTKKSEAKTVYHFQYKAWGNSKKTPDSVEDFVHFIKDVEKSIRIQTEDNPHIVVHCLNGYERSGLFCVVYTMLEKLEAERQVSVVNTVRKIRTHRKQSITCVEQLKYCYQCISAYLEMYNTYSNSAT